MKGVKDYPKLVFIDSEDDPGCKAIRSMQGPQEWLMKTKVKSINDSLYQIIKNSSSAHELYRYFVAFTPHKYIYIFVTGKTFRKVDKVNKLVSNPGTTGVLQTTDGSETRDREVPLIILNTDTPSYFSVGKNDVRQVEWGLIILHELGHIWQKVKARTWYEAQQDKYSRFQQKTGFITLDYNNLLNWEWPISNELGCPIREHYGLYSGDTFFADRARKEYEKIQKRKGEDMLNYRFDPSNRGGIWRPCSVAVKAASKDWARGAPWRADSYEMEYWKLHHQRYTRG